MKEWELKGEELKRADALHSDRNDYLRAMPILSNFEARYAYMLQTKKKRCPGLD